MSVSSLLAFVVFGLLFCGCGCFVCVLLVGFLFGLTRLRTVLVCAPLLNPQRGIQCLHMRNSFIQHNNVRRPGESHRGAGRKKNAVNNYERLAETLPVGISRADLKVTSSDLALLFIRNLPHDANQYCLLHSENETWEALQAAGLKYERQQRLYVELGAFSKRMLHEVAGEQVVSSDGDAQGSETVAAVGTGCGRCGKRSRKTGDCSTDLTGVKCFKCGKTGHIGRNCLSQGQNKTDDKKPSKGSGKQGQKGKPGPNLKAKAKGKGQGKGMYELGRG